MRDTQAITVWCDESSVETKKSKYHLIGTFITNSDTEELEFLNEIIKLRKKYKIWTTFHGSELSYLKKELEFIEDFLNLFQDDENIFFHIFVYRENRAWVSEGFEKYFAKQSAFSLGLKLRKTGYPINTIFSNVGNVKFLFDRRTGESARGLDSDYKNEIKKQLKKQSKRRDDLTVRFSFVSSECFDLMQMTDIFLYMIKLHIEDVNGMRIISKKQEKLLKIFRKVFFDKNMKKLTDYKFSEKFNFFKSV